MPRAIVAPASGDPAAAPGTVAIQVLRSADLAGARHLLDDSWIDAGRWLGVLQRGLRHEPYCLRARRGETTVGLLPLAYVKSLLFGRYLVSLPYVNSAGVMAESEAVARQLVDSAVALAGELNVRFLELRQEREIGHEALSHKNDSKVIMRLALPATSEELWNGFKSKLRSQIRSGQKNNFDVCWGGLDLLSEFYAVFSHNMRDLGTPVYSRSLFAEILSAFGEEAEICVLRLQREAVAAALVIHSAAGTEVPSASSLRAYNSTNANMVMYWHLLVRAIERGQKVFDFGRSTLGGGTHKFKQQWGALPQPSVWQYHVRKGSPHALRPDNGKFGLAIRAWQRLPVWLTRLAGPAIVRGIP